MLNFSKLGIYGWSSVELEEFDELDWRYLLFCWVELLVAVEFVELLVLVLLLLVFLEVKLSPKIS